MFAPHVRLGGFKPAADQTSEAVAAGGDALTSEEQAAAMFERWNDDDSVPFGCLFNMVLLYM